MKDAKDYDVTFPFGATDGVYYALTRQLSSRPDLWIGPGHRGDDRAMPMRTPVPVNGQSIGLSGDASGRYGPHLHIGKFVDGIADNPFGQGFRLDNPRVLDVNLDPAKDPKNGKWIQLVDAQGIVWVYLHLEEIYVRPGDRIGGEMESVNQGDRKNLNIAFFGKDIGVLQSWVGKPWKVAIYQEMLKPSDNDPDSFMFHFKANSGDIKNVVAILGIANANEIKAQNWKDIFYNFVTKNLPESVSQARVNKAIAVLEGKE